MVLGAGPVVAPELEPRRPHNPARTAVAHWTATGAARRKIALRAGHTSLITVLDCSGRLCPDAEERVNAALDRLGTSVAPNPSATVQVLCRTGLVESALRTRRDRSRASQRAMALWQMGAISPAAHRAHSR